MNEFEFADRYLGEYKIKGAEIIPTLCPHCSGGDHRDKNTFALNTENHTFNCRRGSCGIRGHFSELCRMFGEYADTKGGTVMTYAYVKKTYKPSDTAVMPPSDKVTAYINSRKISSDTMTAYGIGTSVDGKICFPFYRSAEDFREHKPTFMKFREPRKLNPGEEKMRSETGTEPILFGLHLCNPSRKILYITEGEFDCMSVYQASEGSVNVVSVPNGAAGFTWIETCPDITAHYEAIAFFGDADAPGKKMLADISTKMSGKTILIPDFDTYRGCKDANEIIFKHGQEGIAKVLASMKPQPVTGLLDLAEIRPVDLSDIGRVMTSIPALDYATGGMLAGDLSIWTGKRGEGKSSFLNQVAIEAIDQDINVCIYSGEVPAERLKYQINLCAAGRENVLNKPDPTTKRIIYYLNNEKLTALDGWYGRRIWLYDNETSETDECDNVIDKFTQAFKRYDCRVFICDNLMTMSTGARASDVMQVQADFVVRLRNFAKKYGVHCHVVVHPRKTANISDSDEVGGMGTITNIACNVFCLKKLHEADGGYWGTGDDGKPCIVKYNTELAILKTRQYGDTGEIKLQYDKDVRRFTQYGKEPNKYSWLKGLEHWETVDEIPDM